MDYRFRVITGSSMGLFVNKYSDYNYELEIYRFDLGVRKFSNKGCSDEHLS